MCKLQHFWILCSFTETMQAYIFFLYLSIILIYQYTLLKQKLFSPHPPPTKLSPELVLSMIHWKGLGMRLLFVLVPYSSDATYPPTPRCSSESFSLVLAVCQLVCTHFLSLLPTDSIHFLFPGWLELTVDFLLSMEYSVALPSLA